MAAVAVLLAAATWGQVPGAISQKEIDYQNEAFQQWWETDLIWRFDDLPTKGSVPAFRVPYSGHDYPDAAGGTTHVLRKYDRAFHGGRAVAASFEHQDVSSFTETTTRVQRRGLFGLRRVVVRSEETPHWHGHCNGWTAAAIRHAEPQSNVTRHGQVFTPADIKGLLAELYMYGDHEFLGGDDEAINPGLLHTVVTNWLGRGKHPLGIDTTVGKEVWNYPMYAFATSSLKRSDGEVEVKMNAAYSQSTRRELDRSQHLPRVIYLHYTLHLNEAGEIVGGTYFNDSARLDFLWAPLHPVQGGEEGNRKGNPHLDMKEVLAMWRESVPAELRNKWWNIDPTEEDRILIEEEGAAAEIRVPGDGESSPAAESPPEN